MKLYWGIAADGSVVISDDLEVIKAGCAKSFAPFPPGKMLINLVVVQLITIRSGNRTDQIKIKISGMYDGCRVHIP